MAPSPLDDEHAPLYTVGQVAQMLAVKQAFLRRVDELRVVSPQRSAGGQRRYTRYEIRIIQQVVSMADEGITLQAIRRIIDLEGQLAAVTRERDELARRELPEAGEVRRPLQLRVAQDGQAPQEGVLAGGAQRGGGQEQFGRDDGGDVLAHDPAPLGRVALGAVGRELTEAQCVTARREGDGQGKGEQTCNPRCAAHVPVPFPSPQFRLGS